MGVRSINACPAEAATTPTSGGARRVSCDLMRCPAGGAPMPDVLRWRGDVPSFALTASHTVPIGQFQEIDGIP